ncbi:MAG: hypothetical protein L6R43_01480 [Planctomycetes bacterium]|nr:hypothetical protein [Planctomycetota bacterium]
MAKRRVVAAGVGDVDVDWARKVEAAAEAEVAVRKEILGVLEYVHHLSGRLSEPGRKGMAVVIRKFADLVEDPVAWRAKLEARRRDHV